jgi:DNA recombination protein RmuC
MEFPVFLFFMAGVVLGATIGGLTLTLWMMGRLSAVDKARTIAETKLASTEAAASKIGETFQSLADAALRSNQGAFLEAARGALDTVRAQITGDLAQRQTAIEGVIQPLSSMLGRMESEVRDLERARQEMLGGLQNQLQSLARETANLSTALRTPQVRGRWGEITLKRVAELAGMVEFCDFHEQQVHESENGRVRPDMVVKLPGGRTLVVDAKVPLSAYLDASASGDDARRREAFMRHGQQVLKHVEQLSSKHYWSQFQPAPELVVLFLPGDHFFSAALEYNPTLIEDALERKVLMATPTTLISVLKGIAYGWRQQQLAENAELIRQVAAEFYERIQTLHGYYSDTGKHLEQAVQAYNRSVASWEARLLPSLRRIRDLGAVTGEEPVPPERIEAAARAPRLAEPV